MIICQQADYVDFDSIAIQSQLGQLVTAQHIQQQRIYVLMLMLKTVVMVFG